MKSKSLLLATSIAFSSISSFAGNYNVTAQFTEDDNGLTAYIINYDTKQKVDSAIVENGKAIFNNTVENPFMAQLVLDGERYGSLIIENGDININNRKPTGTPLNDVLNNYNAKYMEVRKQFSETSDSAKQAAIYNEYLKFNNEVKTQNINNPIGLYLFIQEIYEMDMAKLNVALEQYPQFKSSTRVNNYIAALKQKERTSPGNKYLDFEITYNNKSSKLSDYVKPGKITVVDFWASWCGPCMRQAAVLKEIYAEHKNKGLEIVGVAVWDEPHNTLEAIKTKELPWHNILNAQTIPTDLYGISGIPCIIIIGADGTILSRDKQGDELKEDVRKALAGELK